METDTNLALISAIANPQNRASCIVLPLRKIPGDSDTLQHVSRVPTSPSAPILVPLLVPATPSSNTTPALSVRSTQDLIYMASEPADSMPPQTDRVSCIVEPEISVMDDDIYIYAESGDIQLAEVTIKCEKMYDSDSGYSGSSHLQTPDLDVPMSPKLERPVSCAFSVDKQGESSNELLGVPDHPTSTPDQGKASMIQTRNTYHKPLSSRVIFKRQRENDIFRNHVSLIESRYAYKSIQKTKPVLDTSRRAIVLVRRVDDWYDGDLWVHNSLEQTWLNLRKIKSKHDRERNIQISTVHSVKDEIDPPASLVGEEFPSEPRSPSQVESGDQPLDITPGATIKIEPETQLADSIDSGEDQTTPPVEFKTEPSFDSPPVYNFTDIKSEVVILTVCHVCGFEAVNSTHLSVHIKQCHPPDPKSSASESRLFVPNVRWGTTPLSFECEPCGTVLSSEPMLKSHVYRNHQKTKDSMDTDKYTVKKRFVCTLCGYRYRSLHSFNDHLVRSHMPLRVSRLPVKVVMVDPTKEAQLFVQNDQIYCWEQKNNRKSKCKVCGKNFETRTVAEAHMVKFHLEFN